MKQENLLEQKELREKVIDRLEVLDSVGEILLLPNTEFATVEMVANYYGVGTETIQSLIKDNRVELKENGFRLYKRKEILNVLKGQLEISIPNRGMNLFSKRAILNVGMLLRDSEVAKEIRAKLLDIVHDSEKGEGNIDKIINEIDEEKSLQMKLGVAICEGEMNKVVNIQTKLNDIKNKRIIKLENDKKNIIIHALTIEESKSVINRLVRTLAFTKYNGNFGKAYNELYSKLNYKLHINIKNREKKHKNDSWLDTLNENEMYETEKIVRSWAMNSGIDLEQSLKIA